MQKRRSTRMINAQIHEMRKIYPAWYADSETITNIESIVGNYMYAVAKTAELNETDESEITALLWMYQFEFFERNFFVENYREIFNNRHENINLRHNKRLLFRMLRDNKIKLLKKRYKKYYEEEKKENFSVLRDKVASDLYCIELEGIALVRDFYTILTKERPSIDLTKNGNSILVYSSVTQKRLNSIENDWDSIIKSM